MPLWETARSRFVASIGSTGRRVRFITLLVMVMGLWAGHARAEPAPTEPDVAEPADTTEPDADEPTEPDVAEPAEPDAPEPAEPDVVEPAETMATAPSSADRAASSGTLPPASGKAPSTPPKKAAPAKPAATIQPEQTRLGELIKVTTPALAGLLEKVDGDCKKVILMLDDLPLRGMEPLACDGETGVITFVLHRAESEDPAKDSTKQWQELLGQPQSLTREVDVALTTTNGSIADLKLKLELVLLPSHELMIFVVFFLGITTLFYGSITKGEILRVGSPDAEGRRPYSLSRFQMAFWLYLISVAYVFIWLMLGEQNALNSSLLVLLGLSSGTTLGSTMLDSNKAQASEQKAKELAKEQDKIAGELEMMKEASAGGDAESGSRTVMRTAVTLKEQELERVQRQLSSMPVCIKQSAGTFFKDILNDANGTSLHRLQMFGWTIILGIVFVESVYEHLQMPEFSPTMLSLLGVSSATFLALKAPEKPATASDGEGSGSNAGSNAGA